MTCGQCRLKKKNGCHESREKRSCFYLVRHEDSEGGNVKTAQEMEGKETNTPKSGKMTVSSER